ncbi:hypothetical protein [Aquimarina aggregata]|uniref:hypothetical protein n=1 Tax=Aquimarina aggregata TaxID=1642818 RepID=UPI002491EEC2|nr:hypothetical protein [Aquimarina aggregata]
MIKFTCCISIFLMSSIIFAQKEIVLKTVPFQTEDSLIYIKKVFDTRKEKYLGHSITRSGEKIPFKLSPDASKAVLNFTRASLLPSKNAKPVYIEIQNLDIQQSQISVKNILTRVHVNLVFYEKRNNNLQKLFNVRHYEDEVFAIANESKIFETHEKRVRAALEYCVLSFMNRYTKNIKSKTNLSYKQTNASDVFYTEPEVRQSELGNWYNIVTFKKRYSKHMDGWKISYIGFADNAKDFLIPFVISYDQYKIKPESLQSKRYTSVDAFTLGGGFDGYLKIGKGVYVNLSLNIPVGLEMTKDENDKRQHNFLVGIRSSQGIKIIPWQNFGVVLGAGLFQQIQTSKVYSKNFGVELELGINF